MPLCTRLPGETVWNIGMDPNTAVLMHLLVATPLLEGHLKAGDRLHLGRGLYFEGVGALTLDRPAYLGTKLKESFRASCDGYGLAQNRPSTVLTYRRGIFAARDRRFPCPMPSPSRSMLAFSRRIRRQGKGKRSGSRNRTSASSPRARRPACRFGEAPYYIPG